MILLVPSLNVKEIILSILLLSVQGVILLVLSINHGGAVSTNTGCQHFFIVEDVIVLFHLVHHLWSYTAHTLTKPL